MRGDNLHIGHLNPVGLFSWHPVPRSASLKQHHTLKLEGTSNCLCTSPGTVQSRATGGLGRLVSNNGKGAISAHSQLWGQKHPLTSQQGNRCVFHHSLCCTNKRPFHFHSYSSIKQYSKGHRLSRTQMIRQLNDEFRLPRCPETIVDFTTCYENTTSQISMQAEHLLTVLATQTIQRQSLLYW